MKTLNKSLLIGMLASIFFSCHSTQKESKEANLKDIAYDAFIYAYPMMEQLKTVNDMLQFNNMEANVPALNPQYPMDNIGQPIVGNNLTSMTGGIYIDISGGPVTIEIPEVKDRYCVYQFVDVFTHNTYYLGTRANAGDGGQFTFYNKTQAIPEAGHATPVLIEGDHLKAVIRIDIKDRSEIEQIHQIQSRIKVVEAPETTRNYPSYAKEKAFSPFFVEYINELLTEVPESEVDLYVQFASIGIMNQVNLNEHELKQIQAGIDSAYQAISKEADNLLIGNGWIGATEVFGSREFLNGNYIGRAAGAHFGLWGNSKEEANYFLNFFEGEGSITFTKDQLPPLTDMGFWSITMYDENVYVIPNDYNSYVITMDQMLFEEDGSITITCSSSPEEGNWLYTPGGKGSVMIRAYQANPELIGTYIPPAFVNNKK